MKRRGKIARLPQEIRQTLNERLQEGENAASLAEWLNGLPEVQAILKAEFEGTPIREQNISEWRKGGYEEWRQHENALEMAVRLAQRAGEWKAKDYPSMIELIAFWLMSQLLLATQEVGRMEWEQRWPCLNKMFAHLTKLRRIEQEVSAARSSSAPHSLSATRASATRASSGPIPSSGRKSDGAAVSREDVEALFAAIEASAPGGAGFRPAAGEREPRLQGSQVGCTTKAIPAEKAEQAMQEARAAQLARSLEKAKAMEMAQVVRAAQMAKSAPGAKPAPVVEAEPSVAAVLAADGTEKDALFSVWPPIENGSKKASTLAGLAGRSGQKPILTGRIEVPQPVAA